MSSGGGLFGGKGHNRLIMSKFLNRLGRDGPSNSGRSSPNKSEGRSLDRPSHEGGSLLGV